MTFVNKNASLCMYDIESSGLNVIEDSILEICFIDFNTETTILHIYINPSNGKKIENTKIHQIDEEVLKEKKALDIGPALKKINEELTKFYKKKKIILTAHNNFCFDQLILESEYKRAGIEPPNNILYFDSLPMIIHYFNDLDSYRLGKIYELITNIKEKDNKKLHTAEHDTKCLLTVVKHAFKVLLDRKLKVNIDTFTRMSTFNVEFKNQKVGKLGGRFDEKTLRRNGIKSIDTLLKVFSLTGDDSKLFKSYIKKTYKISSTCVVNKVYKQIYAIFSLV